MAGSGMRELMSTWWPIALPILAIAGSTVRTETIVSRQSNDIEIMRREGVPTTNERLARLETKIEVQNGLLVRIDDKMGAAGRREAVNDRVTKDWREAEEKQDGRR